MRGPDTLARFTMKTFGRFLRWAVAGAVLGHVAATLGAPSLISFWRAPRGATDALCQCSELITTTTTDLIRAQLVGAGVGAVVLLIVGLFVERFLAARRAAKASQSVGMPPASES